MSNLSRFFRASGILVLALAIIAPTPAPATQPAWSIKHRFMALDRSRSQLVHVDQNDPSKDWVMTIPPDCRDFQLIGDDKVLFSTLEGYAEYSMRTRKLLKEVRGYPQAMFARRLTDGRTLLGGYQKGVAIREFDAEGKLLRTLEYPAFSMCRLGRLTPQGRLLLGADNKLVETALDGKVIKTITVPDCQHLFHAVRRDDGHMLVSTGYGLGVAELDGDGKVVKVIGGKQHPRAKELGYFFFAGFQVLRNGNIVVSNWTGFGPRDSTKGVQLVQFDPAGQVVWTWHDPARAGCVHGVIVLDELDTGVLNDEQGSVLGPAKK